MAEPNFDRVLTDVRGWKIGFSESTDGCVASSTYNDQTTVWIGFRGTDAYIAFTNPRWKSIQPKGGYDLGLQTSRRIWKARFFGFERDSERGVYAFGLKTAFVDELVNSTGVRVYLDGQIVSQPSLAGSHDAIAALVACQKQYRQASAPPDSADRRRQGKSSSGSGTGFFVSLDGHVLTNSHVVRSCRKIEIVSAGSRTTAGVVAEDRGSDLALLTTSSKPTVLPAFRSPPRLGESIAIFGFPLTGLLSSSGNFTTGSVTAVTGLSDDPRMVQVSAPVQPGNSGGPLIDKYGNIIGVIVAKLNAIGVASVTNDIPQNVNFAIKSAIATNFLVSNGVVPNEKAMSRELPPEATAELAKMFTVQILCE